MLMSIAISSSCASHHLHSGTHHERVASVWNNLLEERKEDTAGRALGIKLLHGSYDTRHFCFHFILESKSYDQI